MCFRACPCCSSSSAFTFGCDCDPRHREIRRKRKGFPRASKTTWMPSRLPHFPCNHISACLFCSGCGTYRYPLCYLLAANRNTTRLSRCLISDSRSAGLAPCLLAELQASASLQLCKHPCTYLGSHQKKMHLIWLSLRLFRPYLSS